MSKVMISQIDDLVKQLTALKRVVVHIEFDDAIKKLFKDDDRIGSLEDMSTEVILAHLVANYNIEIDINYCLCLKDDFRSTVSRFIDGVWVDV